MNIVFATYESIFWAAKYERKSCLNWMVSLQVLTRSQLIFPSKTWFFGIYLNAQWQKSLKNQYLPHSKSKPYQINPIKSCSSRSFLPPKISAMIWFYFIFSEKIIIFKNFCTASPNIMEPSPCTPPSSLRAVQRHQEHNLKHPDSVDLVITKQNRTNYLPS